MSWDPGVYVETRILTIVGATQQATTLRNFPVNIKATKSLRLLKLETSIHPFAVEMAAEFKPRFRIETRLFVNGEVSM